VVETQTHVVTPETTHIVTPQISEDRIQGRIREATKTFFGDQMLAVLRL